MKVYPFCLFANKVRNYKNLIRLNLFEVYKCYSMIKYGVEKGFYTNNLSDEDYEKEFVNRTKKFYETIHFINEEINNMKIEDVETIRTETIADYKKMRNFENDQGNIKAANQFDKIIDDLNSLTIEELKEIIKNEIYINDFLEKISILDDDSLDNIPANNSEVDAIFENVSMLSSFRTRINQSKEDNYGYNIPYAQTSLLNEFPRLSPPLFNAPITTYLFRVLDNILLLYNEKKSKYTK